MRTKPNSPQGRRIAPLAARPHREATRDSRAKLFAFRGPPTGWSGASSKTLFRLQPANPVLSRSMRSVEFVQSSLTGNASYRGICYRLALAQSHSDQGSCRIAVSRSMSRHLFFARLETPELVLVHTTDERQSVRNFDNSAAFAETLRASEPRHQGVRSRRLAIGADDLDARGRSPMCHQRTRPSLGGEAGGRSTGFI